MFFSDKKEITHTTSEVFNTGRELPLNYHDRSIDEQFINILGANTHCVIYGCSKQGKTSLRKRHINDSECISITCQPNWNLKKLIQSILNKAGCKIISNVEKTIGGEIGAEAELPSILKVSIKLSSEKKYNEENTCTLDLDDINQVIDLLKKINFEKYIILEDFHYLQPETQKSFAYALKAFQDNSNITFIIIGIWLEKDRLTVLNGELSGRIQSINADYWSATDLTKVFENSERLLNVKFNSAFKNLLIELCRGSIFIFQQICAEACTQSGIYKTQPEIKHVGMGFDVYSEIKNILSVQNSRYEKFLTEFSGGFGDTESQPYKMIIIGLIIAEEKDLNRGIYTQALLRLIKDYLVKKISLPQMSVFLSRIIELQTKIDIKPTVIEYNSNAKQIQIVDKAFVIWRAFQEKDDLLELLDETLSI